MPPIVRQLVAGVRALLRPHRADADVADEVEHYLAESTAANLARGLDPATARREAVLATGGALAARERVRTSGWEAVVESALQDVRYALRRLRRSPAFTVTAVATLAVGIGASTAVFSAINPILVEPLPFPLARRIVTLDDHNPQGVPEPATLGTYFEVRARAHAFDVLGAADAWRPSLTGDGTPERLEGERVTAQYFVVFSTVPIVGRSFTPDDDRPGTPNIAIVSSGLAERRLGGARTAVGRYVDLNGDPYLVVGVMPPGFTNVIAPAVEIWSPLREVATADLGSRQWGHHYQLVGRLAATASRDQAAAELRAIGGAPTAAYPRPPWATMNGGLLVRDLQDAIAVGSRPALLAIMVSVLLLLAMAAVNVANLLLARGARRRAEFAMRVALGAGRGRVFRQVVTESVVLALVGGSLGLAVAQLGVRALVAVSPAGLPRLDAIRLDPAALLFAAVVSAVVGLVVGVVPARDALREQVADGLRAGSTRTTGAGHGTRSALVVAQVALALVLVVSAGLLFRSVRILMAIPPGFDPSHVVTMQVVEAGHAFDDDDARLAFYDDALHAVRSLPGVTDAAFTSQLPLSGEVEGYGFELQSRPDQQAGASGSALRYAVSPGYFATMHIPLVAGRLLNDGDRPGAAEAIVINESLARSLFGDRPAVGERMRFGPQMRPGGRWAEVVGVVGDVRHYSLAAAAPAAFYVANGQWEFADNVETLVVRASGDAAALVPELQRAVWSVNPNVPIMRVRTMEAFVTQSAGARRFALLAIQTLAMVALLLAAVGLYGVISGSVAERIREIGIRTALGASPGAVVGGVVRHALILVGVGAVVGIGGALAATRLLTAMMFGVSIVDPLTYGATLALLVVVALLAAWAPARRAVGVDPTIALRAD